MPVEIREIETVYEGYLTLRKATLATADGSIFMREIEDHGQACAVLPYDPQRRCALLVSLPRAPVIWSGGPNELLEAIAGMLDGDPPETCARKAGLRLQALEPVGAAYASPGVSTEKLHLFLAPYASADRTGAGGGIAEEHELITVVELPLAELWARQAAGHIEDLKTLTLLLALRVRHPDLFEGGT
jgi:nudix-type nucleoside diphosphatase (YffH/AdpP family)